MTMKKKKKKMMMMKVTMTTKMIMLLLMIELLPWLTGEERVAAGDAPEMAAVQAVDPQAVPGSAGRPAPQGAGVRRAGQAAPRDAHARGQTHHEVCHRYCHDNHRCCQVCHGVLVVRAASAAAQAVVEIVTATGCSRRSDSSCSGSSNNNNGSSSIRGSDNNRNSVIRR